MQYTSKIALLAVALFGTSALAVPFAGDAEYEVEAREVDNELAAREFYDMYLEARADPSLDARDIESLDFEAREYLEYLEAREAATAGAERLQAPLSPSPKSSRLETTEHSHKTSHSTTASESKHERSAVHLTPHQKSVRRAKKLAAQEFKDPKVYEAALTTKGSQLHKFAVAKYLSKPKHLKKALANVDSPYHKAAKRILHQRKAKVYLKDKSNYKKALTHRRHRYHKDAVKVYFAHGDNFERALAHKHSRFHKAAVHEYLLDTKTRKSILADPTDSLYKQAKKLQRKINKRLRKLESAPGPSDSTTTSSKA